MMNIKQKYYGNIEIVTSERDHVQFWRADEVVLIENESIQAVIDILQTELTNRTS
jgi:hypothetical protein